MDKQQLLAVYSYPSRSQPKKILRAILSPPHPDSKNLSTDLVPREVAEAWLKYLREELPTVAFKCSTQKQAAHLKQGRLAKSRKGGKSSDNASVSGAFTGSDSLGAETLLQLLKNYARNADIKTAITVGRSPPISVLPQQAATLTERTFNDWPVRLPSVCKDERQQPLQLQWFAIPCPWTYSTTLVVRYQEKGRG